MSNTTCVIYNGACPVCSREIESYARYASSNALALRFQDLHDPETQLAQLGLTPDAAAKRLHVLKDGRLLSGVPAFAALWAEMPRFRPLARIVMWPGVRQVATVLYDQVLAPGLYHWHKRRERRLAGGPHSR